MLDDSILQELDALLEEGTVFETDDYKFEETISANTKAGDFPQKLEEYMQLRKSMESFELISDELEDNENNVPELKQEPSHELPLAIDPVLEQLKAKHVQTLHTLNALQNLFRRCAAHTTDERAAMRLVYAV